MRLRHALIQHCSAAAADIEPKSVAEESVAFECHQRFTVLPAEADVF